jgi:DMSO/TMAO reductase YedYZ molybdopterin-dependent catalytic subunit
MTGRMGIMNRTAFFSASLLIAAMLHAQAARTVKTFPPDIAPATITVTGLNGNAIEISMADIVKLPQHTVKTTDHGTPVTFEGVMLKDVLGRVDLPVGDAFRKTAAACYLIVEAADGYRAVFAWAELDPDFMDKPLYLVTHRDGRPLSSNDGPIELVAPGEKRPARWVKQVTALTIRQAS